MAEQKVAGVASPSTSPSEATRPPPGTSFDSNNPESDYEMLDKVGTGSFGTVWKALHLPSNSVVAVKKVCQSLHPCHSSLLCSLIVISVHAPWTDNH